MWKKAFVTLLCLNLLIVVAALLFVTSLPKANQAPAPPRAVPAKAAHVQLSVGAQAINTYLEYALSEDAQVSRVLSYAKVGFANNWNVNLGVKLSDRVVPFTLVFTPQMSQGNLVLAVSNASMGDLPIPNALLFLVFRHLPWPNWISVNAPDNTIHLNFTERPQHPYGLRVLNYSPDTKMLTMLVTILPKNLAKKP